MENSVKQPTYAERLGEYYRRLGTPCCIVNGTLWLEENRIASPFGPASRSYAISNGEAKRLFSLLPSAVVVRSTGGFAAVQSTGKWYCTICRSLPAIEDFGLNTRKQLRKALRQCAVEKVDAKYVADNAYEVHVAAHQRYRRPPQTKERFVANLMIAQDFGDVIDFWVVRYEDIVVGYLFTLLFGDEEAAHAGMAFHPDYFRHYISHALIYSANKYYLQDKSFSYVSNGFRTVWHPSDIYSFLAERFHYELAPLDLYVYYKPWLAGVMSLPSPIRSVVGRFSSKFAALNRLHEARTTPPASADRNPASDEAAQSLKP